MKRSLTGSERYFFAMVAQAAFLNPFGGERLALDRRIAGLPEGVGGGKEAVDRAVGRVLSEVERLEREGRADLRLFSGEERQILHTTLLFDAFHRFAAHFDRLIAEQSAAGERPCAVPFAAEALGLLSRRGFDSQERERYFAFFFQLRRAFFFIDRGLAGHCPSMKELKRRLWNNVFTSDVRWYESFLWSRMEDFSTLLLGETGTGKGAAAAAVGRSGFIPFDAEKGRFAESFARNFIALNLSQYPEALIESELFGHRKGAFTGAVADHQGVFDRCPPHGAIFLDEIGDVSMPVQVKLLQILQERTFSPVGSHERKRFRGRVIAATNRPLEEMRRKGEFRDDFFYRLCSDIIVLPPLRERLKEDPGELEILLDHAVQRTTGGSAPELVKEIALILRNEPGIRYAWPGNVRELEQAVRRILLTRRYRGEETAAGGDPAERLTAAISEGRFDAQGLLSAYCALLHGRHGTYEEVARITGLDRRTAKKYVLAGKEVEKGGV
jgi:DNA-binding NtrC family response regulator